MVTSDTPGAQAGRGALLLPPAVPQHAWGRVPCEPVLGLGLDAWGPGSVPGLGGSGSIAFCGIGTAIIEVMSSVIS